MLVDVWPSAEAEAPFVVVSAEATLVDVEDSASEELVLVLELVLELELVLVVESAVVVWRLKSLSISVLGGRRTVNSQWERHH